MTCEVLGVSYSEAKSADELTNEDRYVAFVISEARRLHREPQTKEKG
jgi:hypothetical protein